MRSTSSPRAVSMMIGVCASRAHLAAQAETVLARQHDVEDERSTRWSAMARDISRPSLTVVTLQELLRRYFAINVAGFAVVLDDQDVGRWHGP